MIKVAIVGATGYTGLELLKLLAQHEHVEIAAVTSNSKAGAHVTSIYPHFKGILDITLSSTDELNPAEFDVVFLGLPHGISMDFVKKAGLESTRIIDLSGDFRLSSPDLYNTWYPREHVFPEAYTQAVYGLPELFREDIRDAVLVANPGCYPTSAILPLVPLIKEDIIDAGHIFVDAKSGVTGAGAHAKPNTHYPVVNDNFSAYGIATHRHTPEMQDVALRYSGVEPRIQFTPHLLPVSRGILATCYGILTTDIEEEHIQNIYENYYGNEPFVRLVDAPPELNHIRGSNFCDIFFKLDKRTGHIITVSCIDNMVKGAAGQAVQNMNIMFGFEETSGLHQTPLYP